ncbi:MAG: hypothetical protein OXI02_06000 [Candidatus Dadabacteria bacterium]|nr:hypothetical protein [Candidatus Dadabacteria bacterium]MDE0477596.1 hypothetical protein [Candidatus Dadabacteria bacterium]
MDSRAWVSLVLASVFLIQFSPALGRALEKDLGVHGKLYEIKEEDMLSYVRRKAGEIDMRELRESMERKLEESYAQHSLVSLKVPSATEERVRYVDPSVKVRNPLYDHTGKMIFPAGVVNPLDHVSLSKSILVLREDQVKRVLAETDKRGEKPILLLTDGDIRRASSLVGQPVYKANLFVLKKLKIEKVPSIVGQEGRKLRVEETVLK